jgi:ParB family transcriptional regulator, chromosome partitioning protein
MMNKKPALGKGLNALLPAGEYPEMGAKGVFLCPVDRIESSPSQPRKRFDEQGLASLADTIKDKGILQPLLVRKVGTRYELIAGERRLRAARKAGLQEVPVLVREAEESDSLELSILENIQREDLNPIEEARAYKQMMDRLDLTQEELARRVGKDRSSVANAVRLLHLPREIQEDLSSGQLSAGHARALLGMGQEILQLKLWALIRERGLSVREAEKYVLQFKEGRKKEPRPMAAVDPDMQALQDELSQYFGTRVMIQKGRKGGRIQIRYASVEELNRIYSLMVH